MVFYCQQGVHFIKYSQKLHLYFIDDSNASQISQVTCPGSLGSGSDRASTQAVFESPYALPTDPLVIQLCFGHGTAVRLREPFFFSVTPGSGIWKSWHDSFGSLARGSFSCRASFFWHLFYSSHSKFTKYLSSGSFTKFCHFLAEESWDGYLSEH